LKNKRIKGSKPCAIATTQLLLRAVAEFKGHEIPQFMFRVRHIGKQLVDAQPKELVIENIIIRILSLIREVSSNGSDAGEAGDATDDGASDATPTTPMFDHGPTPSKPSLFWFFPQGEASSQTSTPRSQSPTIGTLPTGFPFLDIRKLKSEIIDGIKEMLEEIDQASDQVADNSLSYINANDKILIQGGSSTIQRFLTVAASKKRKFTVFVVDGTPNKVKETHNQILTGTPYADKLQPHDRSFKPLTSLGITVVLIPDSAVFSIMQYVDKVIIAPHFVLQRGGLLADVGTANIALAAHEFRKQVISLSGVYKMSFRESFDPRSLCEIGGADGDLNPLWDFVPESLVSIYVTNL
jgi:translation initiation factor eIF-2B subunit beta